MLEDEVREDNGAQPAEGVADDGVEPDDGEKPDDGGGPGGGEKPNGDGLPEDEARSPDEAATADQQVSIAGLEAAVAAREGEITTLKESVVGLEERLTAAVGSLAEAVVRYRAAIVRANPEVVADLITRDTIEGIDESLVTARNVIDRVKQGLEEETALARVPAGAPERRTPDLSALSSREKIRYAIGGKR